MRVARIGDRLPDAIRARRAPLPFAARLRVSCVPSRSLDTHLPDGLAPARNEGVEFSGVPSSETAKFQTGGNPARVGEPENGSPGTPEKPGCFLGINETARKCVRLCTCGHDLYLRVLPREAKCFPGTRIVDLVKP